MLSLVVPVWIVDIPPLVDVINHGARIFIIANVDSNPFFAEHFEVVFEPIPNMALDLFVLPLIGYAGLWTALKLFITASILLFAFGSYLLSGADGDRPSPSFYISLFLFYGSTFYFGYLNYLFGIALFLVTLGLWLRWRSRYSPSRLLTLIFLGLACYLSHLSSIAFLGAAIFTVNATDLISQAAEERRTLRDHVFDGLIFGVPFAALLIYMGRSAEAGLIELNSLYGKIAALLGPFRGLDLPVDIAVAATLAVFIGMMAFVGKVSVERRLFTIGIVFLLLFVLSPRIFVTSDTDVRFVLPAVVLLILSLRMEWPSGKTLFLFSLLLTLFFARQAITAYRFLEMESILDHEIALLSAIPPNSRVLAFRRPDAGSQENRLTRPIESVVQMVSINNSSFTPKLFAIRGHNPLVFRHKQHAYGPEHPVEGKWLESLAHYDYLWTHDVSPEVTAMLETRAARVAERGKTTIWKLHNRSAKVSPARGFPPEIQRAPHRSARPTTASSFDLAR